MELKNINLNKINLKSVITSPVLAASDPFYSNVSLLLHFDGSDGSRIFTDNSPNPKTLTTTGDPVIVTNNYKFGGSSVWLNGIGTNRAYLTANSAADFNFGTGDFTFECWLNQVTLTSGNIFTFATQQWVVYFAAVNSTLRFFDTVDRITSTATLTLNSWNHIALTRQGTSIRLYLNGAQTGITYTDPGGPTNLGQAQVLVGFFPADVSPTGYMDDFRVTKGVARYTGATYTVPTAAFPDT